MTEKRDEELVMLYRRGNAEAVDILMDRYKLLVRRISRARFLIGGDEEDLIQEGMIGLYKAVRDYEEGQGASFKTFAALCINRQMIKAIDASNSQKNRPLNEFVSLDAYDFDEDTGNEKNSPEHILIGQEQEREILERIRGALSPLEKRVFELYLLGQDYREIAISLDRSPKSIDNAIQRIRKKTAQTIGIV